MWCDELIGASTWSGTNNRHGSGRIKVDDYDATIASITDIKNIVAADRYAERRVELRERRAVCSILPSTNCNPILIPGGLRR